jgi:DUSP domain
MSAVSMHLLVGSVDRTGTVTGRFSDDEVLARFNIRALLGSEVPAPRARRRRRRAGQHNSSAAISINDGKGEKEQQLTMRAPSALKLHSTSDCTQMKATVKTGLGTAMTLKAVWCPVAMPWFVAWKAYVDWEDEWSETERGPRPPDLLKSLHPGVIDNAPLLGTVGDELRPGLAENVDYVLLPRSAYLSLVREFDGGPDLGRYVQIKRGTGSSAAGIPFLDLYPVRCDIYVCHSKTGKPKGGNHARIDDPAAAVAPDEVLYYASTFPLDR